ncbi:MAG: hypothetical protein K2X74_19935 [Acetobacteraceae bacterium]|nr:hypothetical protein [Acetobacteraceae bacterium]
MFLVGEGGPFENLATATLIAAIRVAQMVAARDGTTRRPMSDAFNPTDQPATAAICARLGGWTGYYGKPGPIAIHRGIIQRSHIIRGRDIRGHV